MGGLMIMAVMEYKGLELNEREWRGIGWKNGLCLSSWPRGYHARWGARSADRGSDREGGNLKDGKE